jgi:hypothetical protein
MKRTTKAFPIALAIAAGFLALEKASAQPFVYQPNDLALGFRKTGTSQGTYEAVVNLGQASIYFGAAIGTTLTITNFSASQLTPSTFANLNNLSWSVFGYYSGSGFGASYPSSAASTLWVTVPRANIAVRSADPTRLTRGQQASARSPISSILANAAYVSGDSGASAYNTATFVRESIATYPLHLLTVWMGSIVDPTVGTLNDTWPEGDLEITTPGSFTTAVRSDLYEVRPLADASGSGPASYIGYFEFKSNGTMTFTREVASTAPAQVTLNVARTNNVSTISFGSASSVTYKLCFTNSAGLGAAVSTWPSLPGSISGDGTTKSFQDATTDPVRFYRVLEQ